MPRSLLSALAGLVALGLASCGSATVPATTPVGDPATVGAPPPSSSARAETPVASPIESPSPSSTPAPSPLTWDQLKNTTYLLPESEGGPRDGRLVMQDGTFTWSPVPGSASVNRYLVYPGVAFGDLDGDGLNEAVVVLVNNTAGSGTFYYLAPVLNDGGQPRTISASFIGDRVIIDQVRVLDGELELQLKTYRPDEPFGSTPTLQVVRRFSLQDGTLQLLAEQVLNADEVASETQPRDVLALALPDGGGRVSQTGAAGPFGLNEYTFHGLAGQSVTVTVRSPHEDVFLSVYALGSSDVLARALDETWSWSGPLPATSDYALNVFSIGSETVYTLTIEAGAPPAASVPPEDIQAPSTPVEPGAVVYLTFDDGPQPPYTPEVLGLLGQYGARATFFVLGQNAQARGELLDAAYEGGHALGNHTWSHRSLAGISYEDFQSEIAQTAAVLGPRQAPCMRPPYGATDSFTRAYAAELGYKVILWNVDTLDWSRPGIEEIVATAVDHVYPGAIVLMHDGGGDRHQTVAALAAVLQALTERGYRLEALCR